MRRRSAPVLVAAGLVGGPARAAREAGDAFGKAVGDLGRKLAA